MRKPSKFHRCCFQVFFFSSADVWHEASMTHSCESTKAAGCRRRTRGMPAGNADHNRITMDTWQLARDASCSHPPPCCRRSPDHSLNQPVLPGSDRDESRVAPTLLGVRIATGQGIEEVDLYVVCGYSTTQDAAAETRTFFWDGVDRAPWPVSRRPHLIVAMHANATAAGDRGTFPWISRAGAKATKESREWNEHGRTSSWSTA